nr:hypothetical protein [Tanacetum cinerariifolium]
SKTTAQDLEIYALKARIKHLENRDGGDDDPSGEDATIMGRSLETEEEACIERSTEKGSDDIEEMLEEEMARDAQRMNEQIARDAEITRIHAEEELQMMIDGLDRSNVMIAKHLHEYDQAGVELTIREKIELINELVKYQDHLASILKLKGKEATGKIIRLGGSTASYQFFVDMLNHFDREDLNQLWALVKKTLNIKQATSNKEKELWVELKRLYEPDVEDQL